MSVSYPPQDLDCPDPPGCPVLGELPVLSTVAVAAGTPLFRVYDARWGYDEYNPGFGDARFSPVDDPETAERVGAIYLAASEEAALLETVFHDVHQSADRVVYGHHLRNHLVCHLELPRDVVLGDLRDDALVKAGLGREQVVSTPSEHYPCTRRLAVQSLRPSQDAAIQGLIWHSRQSELSGSGPVDVIVLFAHRYGDTRGDFALTGPGARNLFEGPGRIHVDSLAERLSARIEIPD